MRLITSFFNLSTRKSSLTAEAGQPWVDGAFFGRSGIELGKMSELPPITPLPAGWMSNFDLRVLYNVALNASGPFLEIGPWIGRSTSAICAGLRDSGTSKIFDVLDFGICGVDEYRERFGYMPDFDHPDHVKGQLRQSITARGGTLAVLIENLRLNGLLEYTTTISRGDWIECPHGRKYGFVFIDAVHNIDEANRHVPKLRNSLLPGAIVVVDDVVDAEFARTVCNLLGSIDYALTRSISDQNKLMITR